jgi:hypothetical protein
MKKIAFFVRGTASSYEITVETVAMAATRMFGFPRRLAESRRRRNLPALFFRSRQCSVLLTETRRAPAPLPATALLRTTTLATTALELRAAPLSAATLELHTTTLAAAALNPDIATTSVDLNFVTATTSTVEFASAALSITPAVPALTAAPA